MLSVFGSLFTHLDMAPCSETRGRRLFCIATRHLQVALGLTIMRVIFLSEADPFTSKIPGLSAKLLVNSHWLRSHGRVIPALESLVPSWFPLHAKHRSPSPSSWQFTDQVVTQFQNLVGAPELVDFWKDIFKKQVEARSHIDASFAVPGLCVFIQGNARH